MKLDHMECHSYELLCSPFSMTQEKISIILISIKKIQFSFPGNQQLAQNTYLMYFSLGEPAHRHLLFQYDWNVYWVSWNKLQNF